MITYQVLNALLNVIAVILIPIQFLCWIVFSILDVISFRVFKVIIYIIWLALFGIAILALSFIYERVKFLRVINSIIGIPISIIGFIYLHLLYIGDTNDEKIKLVLFCSVFPYSWHFFKFLKLKTEVVKSFGFNNFLSVLEKQRVSDKGANEYILRLRSDFITQLGSAPNEDE